MTNKLIKLLTVIIIILMIITSLLYGKVKHADNLRETDLKTAWRLYNEAYFKIRDLNDEEGYQFQRDYALSNVHAAMYLMNSNQMYFSPLQEVWNQINLGTDMDKCEADMKVLYDFMMTNRIYEMDQLEMNNLWKGVSHEE